MQPPTIQSKIYEVRGQKIILDFGDNAYSQPPTGEFEC